MSPSKIYWLQLP